MKKNLRIVLTLLSLSVFLFCLSGLASAKESLEPLPLPEGEVVVDSHSSIVVKTRSDIEEKGTSLIRQWSCGIQDNLNGTVAILGDTNTSQSVQYLDAKVYLQRWDGSEWVDVCSRTYSTSNNFYVSGSSNISGSSGDHYRTRSVHTARNAGSNDVQTSVSSAVLVE